MPGTRGYLDDVRRFRCHPFSATKLVDFMRNQKSEVLAEIVETKDLARRNREEACCSHG